MPSKPIDQPPEVARAFVRDMRAFHAEKDAIKRDEIASRQMRTLQEIPRDRGKSRFASSDIKEMFVRMRDE
jgi:hypothetical protein